MLKHEVAEADLYFFRNGQFLHGCDSSLVRKFDVFALAAQAVNLLNLFVTFGDTFLPSPQSYDDLYYEIIRMHHVFDNLHAMALRYSTGDAEYRESAVRLSAALINVRAIGQHFKPKIELWMESQKISTPSQEQVRKFQKQSIGKKKISVEL